MADQDRGDRGRYAAKGNQVRAVRTVRLTDAIWQALGDKADEKDMSKADYLEALFANKIEWESEESNGDFEVDQVVEILKDALAISGKAGAKIKAKVKEALTLMGVDLDSD